MWEALRKPISSLFTTVLERGEVEPQLGQRQADPWGCPLPLSSGMAVDSELHPGRLCSSREMCQRRCTSHSQLSPAGILWGALSLFAACSPQGGRERGDVTLTHNSCVQLQFPGKGGCETLGSEEAASLTSSLGSTEVRTLAHRMPAASLGQAEPVLVLSWQALLVS